MEIRKVKNNSHNLFLGLFLLLVVFLALIISFNSFYFESLIQGFIERYGFLGVLVFSFIADILFQPIGSEIPALIGILFGFNIILVLIVTIIGSMLASLTNYYLGGKYFKNRIEEIYNKKEERKKYLDFFKKHGRWAVTISSISPVPWAPVCWLAKSFKVNLKIFTFYGLIPRIIRILVVVLGVDAILGDFWI